MVFQDLTNHPVCAIKGNVAFLDAQPPLLKRFARRGKIVFFLLQRHYSMTSLLSDNDLYLFNEGSHIRLYQHLGAHPRVVDRQKGTNFSVWAPDAERVYVMGDFNNWDKTGIEMRTRGDSGIWEMFVPKVGQGDSYKYHIISRHDGYSVDKADPFAFHTETPPKTASKVWDLSYEWFDREWMAGRKSKNEIQAPTAIYEVHLGSWKRIPEDRNRSLSYREMAPQLAD